MKIKEKRELCGKKKIFWCLLGIFLVSALPLFTNYCLNSAEVPYQLVRIEELKNHLSAGIFQAAMPVNWQYEHGTAGLDSNLFWLLPAVLRGMGLPLEAVYRIFLLGICVVTVWLSYIAFRKLFQDQKLGLFGCMLYSWTPWYLDTLYGRAAIGEALGYAFLPVLLLFLAETSEQEKKLPRWLLLTVGVTLLLQSSFAVLLIGMLLLAFGCIYERKRMLDRQGLLTLGKAALATLLVNLWYMLPLARYLIAYRDVVRYVGSRPFQEKGVFLLHYLNVFFQPGTVYDYQENGFQGSAAVGIGAALLFLLLLFLWLEFSGQLRLREQKPVVRGMFWCGVLGVLLSLGSFPWDFLRRNAVFQVLTFSMQSPVIFMILGICGFTMTGGHLLEFYRKKKSSSAATILEITVVVIAFVTTQYLTNGLLLDRAPLWIRESEDLPELVLVEAPQLQISMAGGKAELAAIALGVVSVLAILGYYMRSYLKNRKNREAA